MDNDRIIEALRVQALGDFPAHATTRIEWHAADAITKLTAELDAALTVIAEAEVISRGPWPFAHHTAARVEQLRATLAAGPSTARNTAGSAAASVLEAFADRMANGIYLETGGSAHHEAFNRAHLDAATLARAEATRIREQATHDAGVPPAARASDAGFTCGLRLTCARCDFQVCGNPQHLEYNADPHAQMAWHKGAAHGDDAAHV